MLKLVDSTNYTDGTPFCVEGTQDGSKLTANTAVLQSSNLWNGTCTIPDAYHFYCDTGTIYASSDSVGSAGVIYRVNDQNLTCTVDSRGYLKCVTTSQD